MVKKFIAHFGEEVEPVEEPPRRAAGGRFLPRYIITGDVNPDWATEKAKRMYALMTPVPDDILLIKILLVAGENDEGEVVPRRGGPAVSWSICTNNENVISPPTKMKFGMQITHLDELYNLDTYGALPSTPGTRGQVTDNHGKNGVIEVASVPQPAPWWDRKSMPDLMGTLENMIYHDDADHAALDQIADEMGIIFARGLPRDLKRDVILKDMGQRTPEAVEALIDWMMVFVTPEADDDDDAMIDEQEEFHNFAPEINAIAVSLWAINAIDDLYNISHHINIQAPPGMTVENLRSLIYETLLAHARNGVGPGDLLEWITENITPPDEDFQAEAVDEDHAEAAANALDAMIRDLLPAQHGTLADRLDDLAKPSLEELRRQLANAYPHLQQHLHHGQDTQFWARADFRTALLSAILHMNLNEVAETMRFITMVFDIDADEPPPFIWRV